MEYKKEDFPQKAIYRQPSNVIPFITDFEDGQEVMFSVITIDQMLLRKV